MKNFNNYKPKILIRVILGLTATLFLLTQILLSNSSFTLVVLLKEIIKTMIPTGIILGIFEYYNKNLWKYPILNKLIQVPNVEGSYYGNLISTYRDKENQPIIKDCVIEIKQTGTDFIIYGYYACDDEKKASSVSESRSYSLISEGKDKMELAYYYINKPQKPSDKYGELNQHNGSGILCWNAINPDAIAIEYYNKDRNSKGHIQLTKISTDLKGEFYRPI
ncbi:Cap15 family cyclic dinucleotide receptor domain-containing protein [Flavobacterium sp.]|uniref:Cap15 family cyclic dinucleotide receptor domain-containing protein n=2 Tax=Flavobacterium sp. TaxID=239 RepID=UPI0040489BF5